MRLASAILTLSSGVLLCGPTAQAFTIQSGFTESCHERMSADAFSEFLDVPVPDGFVVSPESTWRKLIDGVDMRLFGVELSEEQNFILFSLVVGVRAPDTDGHSVTNLEQLSSLHGDPRPEGQYLHALRGFEDDGPEGDVTAVAGIRKIFRESVLTAVDAARKSPEDQIGRAPITLDFYNRFGVDVWEPAFLLAEAMHTLQDSFSHSIRSEATNERTIAHVLNFVEAISTDFYEPRDGIAHSNHVDDCNNADVAELFEAARTATVELIQVFREVRAGDEGPLDAFIDRWLTLEEGCTFDNDFCGNARWLAVVRQDPTSTYLPEWMICTAGPWRSATDPAQTVLMLMIALVLVFVRRLGRRGAVVAATLICGLSSPATADDTHYRGVPIGSHPIGLGTAFTGVADDASSAYHNPAGLVGYKTFGLAGALTILAFERTEVSPGFANDRGSEDFVAKGQRTVPVFVAAVVKFGPRNKDGHRRFALGYSVAQPLFSRNTDSITIPDGSMSDTLTVEATDRATFFGLSFAAALNVRHSLGLSWYLSLRRLGTREVEIVSEGGTMISGTENFVGATVGSRQSFVSVKAFHFVPRLGWLYRIRENLTLGAMLQLPGIPLRQRADVQSQFALTIGREAPEPSISRFFFYDDEVKAHAPIPLELEVGVGYRPSKKILLAMDVSFHAPVRDKARVNLPPELAGTNRAGFFFNAGTERRAIGNVAIGGDFSVSKRVMIELGAFTDFSAAPKIPSEPTGFQVAHINRYGATASVAFQVAGVSLAVGATGIFGRGDATGAFIDFENETAGYSRSDAKSRLIFVHITGANQVVSKVEDKTEEWLEGQAKKKEVPDVSEEGGAGTSIQEPRPSEPTPSEP